MRESPTCALKTRDNTIKQVHKFNYLGSLLTENGKCDEEIKKRIGMATDAFQKLQKIVKNSKLSWHKKMDTRLLCKTYPNI